MASSLENSRIQDFTGDFDKIGDNEEQMYGFVIGGVCFTFNRTQKDKVAII